MNDFFTKHQDIYSFELPKNIILWVLEHVRSPINGFEHKKDMYGEPISEEEQISQSQFQVLLIASDYFQRGASPDRIIHALSYFEKNCSSN